jgi:hypothetical protein
MKNDPFSQLGALDQKLFQPPSQVREKTELNKKPESPQTHLPVKPKDGKPVSGLEEKPASSFARKTANEQPEKYTTRLEPSMIKRVKVFAAQQEIKDYEVVKQALTEYFERNS